MSTSHEASPTEILRLFSDHMRRWTGRSPEVAETKDGFVVNGQRTEVRSINALANEFRLKASQVDRCIEQRACVLMVNGWGTPFPQFTVIPTEKLAVIKETTTPRGYEKWGGKPCYLLSSGWFTWTPLKA